MGETKTPTHRTFKIVMYETNPKTGEALFSEQDIIAGLKFRTITRWAYILHDKDIYSEEDEAKWNKQLAEAGESPESWAHPVRAGAAKPRHWHIVIYCRKPLEAKKIAEWFGVPEELVRIPNGNGAFWSGMEYLTHEHPKDIAHGKHRYADGEAKSNVDWRGKLEARVERRKRRDAYEMNAEERLQYDVMYNGLTIAEAMDKDPETYMKCSEKIRNLRQDYLSHLPLPRTRINYYVEGKGGEGKSLLCCALARSLCPDLKDDNKIFYKAGLKGSALDGYDGQRVIIWEDRFASVLWDEMQGSNLSVFDLHPTESRQYTRYGWVALRNEVNIVNGIQPFEEFIATMAESNDYGRRRFPFIIRLREEDYDLLLNKGYVENTRNYKEYIEYQHIRHDLPQLMKLCGYHGACPNEIVETLFPK